MTKVAQKAQLSTGEEGDVRETLNSYAGLPGQEANLGWRLRQPTQVITDPSGMHLTHTTLYNQTTGQVEETRPPEGQAGAPFAYVTQWGKQGSGEGQLNEPVAVALDGEGNAWVADCRNNRVEKFSSLGKYLASYGPEVPGEGSLSCPGGLAINQQSKTLYISDFKHGRIVRFSLSKGTFEGSFGKEGAGAGELKDPSGLALDAEGNVWVTDGGNNRLAEFSSAGAFKMAVGWGVLNAEHKTQTCTTSCLAGQAGSEEGELSSEAGGLAVSGATVYLADAGNHRVDEFSTAGAYTGKLGVGLLEKPVGVAIDSQGHLYVPDFLKGEIFELSSSGAEIAHFGTKGKAAGQFEAPFGVALGAAPSSYVYVVDATNDRVQVFRPSKPLVHDTQSVYYSAEGEASVAACQHHPEWAGLPCEVRPGAQPETQGLPNLAETTIVSYNTLGEPLKSEEHFGGATRTKVQEYDSAGRPTLLEESSSAGEAMPKIRYKYNPQLGGLEEQTSEGSESHALRSEANSLGELTSYTDASGNASSYKYDEYERLVELNDGKGIRHLEYSETSGLPTRIADSAFSSGAFSASYDEEGNLASETFPGGLSASYARNTAGEPVSLEYRKTTDCSSNCVWYTDAAVPSIHGQWLQQTSTYPLEPKHNSTLRYAYNANKSLTEVKDELAGKCTTRQYELDQEGNRTGLVTSPPNGEGKCSRDNEATEYHAYDEANRLIDGGVAYNAFGDLEKLPGKDAGSSEPLISSFFVNNQLSRQEQGGQTVGYRLDPEGRQLKITSTGKITAEEEEHYAGPGQVPAWTSEINAQYTRMVQGIAGGLVAIQHDGETPALELSNLHGDIVATASSAEGASGLSATPDVNEYGVPGTEGPPKYDWLGFHEVPTTLAAGAIAMGLRSYVPELGRFLQPDPVEAGSINAYAYTNGDPVNSFDLTGAITMGFSSDVQAVFQQGAREAVAKQIAIEEAERREAEERARAAAAAAGVSLEGWEEWSEEEWGEEEWGEEEVALHAGEGRQGHPLVEEGVLFNSTLDEEVSHNTLDQAVISRCQQQLHRTKEFCTRAVGFISEALGAAWHVLSSGYHTISGALASAWHAFVHWISNQTVRTVGCELGGAIGGVALGVGLARRWGPVKAAAAGAAFDHAYTWGCEHRIAP